MFLPLCRSCGRVKGDLNTARTYVRATCYCKHCQAYARWLGTPGLTDAAGGSDGGAVDAAFGPAGRCVLNTKSAIAPVRATPLAFALGGLRIVMGILGARLRKLRASPFFDEVGRPVGMPEVVAVKRG